MSPARTTHQRAPANGTHMEAAPAVAPRLPPYKLREQDTTSLAEIALSLANEQEEFLASVDSRSLALLSGRLEEQIGTPVKAKKSRGKSPTGGEKQPLTLPKAVNRHCSPCQRPVPTRYLQLCRLRCETLFHSLTDKATRFDFLFSRSGASATTAATRASSWTRARCRTQVCSERRASTSLWNRTKSFTAESKSRTSTP